MIGSDLFSPQISSHTLLLVESMLQSLWTLSHPSVALDFFEHVMEDHLRQSPAEIIREVNSASRSLVEDFANAQVDTAKLSLENSVSWPEDDASRDRDLAR